MIIPSAPSLNRASRFIEPKVEIVIACEGKNTEPRYFSDCVAGYGAGLVRLRVLAVTGVPITVVKEAIRERESLLEKYRRSSSSYDSVFRVWAVFDRDDHPQVAEALELAKNNKIDVAFSDPCFEVWPLLHLIDYGAQEHRHAVQHRLRSIMKTYDHEHGAIIDFPLIKDKFELAYTRASIQLVQRESEGALLGCPCTTVGFLVKKIVENGKISARISR